MIDLIGEDLLDGPADPSRLGDQPRNAGEHQAVRLMKEEKMADATDDMVQEVDGPIETDEEVYFVIQKS